MFTGKNVVLAPFSIGEHPSATFSLFMTSKRCSVGSHIRTRIQYSSILVKGIQKMKFQTVVVGETSCQKKLHYQKSEVKTWGFKIYFEIICCKPRDSTLCRISWKKMWIAYEFCKVCVCFLQRDSPWEEYMGITFLCFQTALNTNLRLPHPTDWKVEGYIDPLDSFVWKKHVREIYPMNLPEF